MKRFRKQMEKAMIKKRISIWVTAIIVTGSVAAVQAAEPTHKDIRYAKKYEQSVLDVWTVKSEKPAPLVVYFHGGGFKGGDKSHFYRSQFIKKYHPKGVAFATVNYPFLKHTNDNYGAILQQTAEAIKFLGSNAKKYNIDNKRISVMGTSAGALISGYLGHGSRMPIRSVFAHEQPLGTSQMILPILRKGGPPIVLFNTSGPGDRVHHPDNATAVHKRCKQIGVYSEVYGSKRSGLPEVPKGQDIHDIVMKFFYKSWRLPFPGDGAGK